MTVMCPHCTLPTAPHGRSECYQPLVLVEAGVLTKASNNGFTVTHTQHLSCPVCHYSEAMLTPEPKGSFSVGFYNPNDPKPDPEDYFELGT